MQRGEAGTRLECCSPWQALSVTDIMATSGPWPLCGQPRDGVLFSAVAVSTALGQDAKHRVQAALGWGSGVKCRMLSTGFMQHWGGGWGEVLGFRRRAGQGGSNLRAAFRQTLLDLGLVQGS